MSKPRIILTVGTVLMMALFLAAVPVSAQGGGGECENCLGEGGMPEPCDPNDGRNGWTDCYLLLGFLCGGNNPCEMQTDALALGLDGLRRGQLTNLEMGNLSLPFQAQSLEQSISVRGGPAAWEIDPIIRIWRDCSGRLKGVLKTIDEVDAIRERTEVIIF